MTLPVSDRLRALRERATGGTWTPDTEEEGDVVIWAGAEEWVANIGDWSLQRGTPERIKFVQLRDAATAHLITVLANVCEAIEGVIATVKDADGYVWGCRECSRVEEHGDDCAIGALDRALREQLDRVEPDHGK